MDKYFPRDMSFIDRDGKRVQPNKKDYEAAKKSQDYNKATALNNSYDSLISKYVKGLEEVYKFEREELGMTRGGKSGKLEGTLAIVGIGASIFFLSGITGNVVGNSTVSNSLGVVLFILGIISSFIYFSKK